MNILITGSKGFVAKNLIVKLKSLKKHKLYLYNRSTNEKSLLKFLKNADIIVHLAGTNRSDVKKKFNDDNYLLTKKIITNLNKLFKKTPILYSSSIMANDTSLYGKSKLKAEKIINDYSIKIKSKSNVFRLTNIFGKWSKPDYNSVIATFCYNLARDKKINIYDKDKNKLIKLIYIDDLVEYFIKIINSYPNFKTNYKIIHYKISIKKLSEKLIYFNNNINTNIVPVINNDFDKKLYSTLISFLPLKKFTSKIILKKDKRGTFTEIFKNSKFGQVSMFSINPNKTRGGHYHNTKTESFLVIQGKATFNLQNLNTKKNYKITISSKDSKIIKIPSGYHHSIKNLKNNKCVILVWANEIFNPNKHDTFTMEY
jgi:UDP-2-acetamido-2,6-beta-L-arabino-hexul-4-ose reductase